jgi:hypothetical protein
LKAGLRISESGLRFFSLRHQVMILQYDQDLALCDVIAFANIQSLNRRGETGGEVGLLAGKQGRGSPHLDLNICHLGLCDLDGHDRFRLRIFPMAASRQARQKEKNKSTKEGESVSSRRT